MNKILLGITLLFLLTGCQPNSTQMCELQCVGKEPIKIKWYDLIDSNHNDIYSYRIDNVWRSVKKTDCALYIYRVKK